MHRSIDCSTWDDPWFTDLPSKSKLLFLFLITNRRVNQCGAMEITIRQIAFETGLTPGEIPNAIEAMGDRVRWWPGSNLLIVRNFYKHQRANTGDKFDVAARKSAESLPDFAKEWLYGVYPHLSPTGYTHTIPTSEVHPSHTISEAEAEAEAEAGFPQTPKGAEPRAHRIPDDFAVDEGLTTWALTKGFSQVEVDYYGEAFVRYWQGEGGARARKIDWRKTFQGWLLRETPGKRKLPNAVLQFDRNSPEALAQRAADAMARLV